MIELVIVVIILAIIYMIYHLCQRKSIWDQILAANSLMNLMVLLILIYAVVQSAKSYIDTAVLFAFLSFVGSFFILIYLYRKGDL